MLESKASRYMYWHLLEQTYIETNQSSRVRWEYELQIIISQEEWDNMYNKIRRITIPTKLQFFQYRILNKVLTTNVKRHM